MPVIRSLPFWIAILLLAIAVGRLLIIVIVGPESSEIKDSTYQEDDSFAITQPPAAQTTFNVDDVALIQSWNLFGQAVGNVQSQAAEPDAPVTQLQLELQGVFEESDGKYSSAIIAEKGQDGTLYRIGDFVAEGVQLDRIFATYVLLSRGGYLERLEFASESGNSNDNSLLLESVQEVQGQQTYDSDSDYSSNANSTQVNQATEKKVENASEPVSTLGKMIASGNQYAPEEILKGVASDLAEKPEAAVSELGLLPQGGNKGYLVGASVPADILSATGLRRGDMVLSINNQAVGNASTDASLIQAAVKNKNLKIEVQRGSRTFTIPVVLP
ncbi:MAG: type II secretion system protein N [Pseudomonadota bacterium]